MRCQMAVSPQVIVHAANGLNVFATFILFLNIKMNPQRFLNVSGAMRVQSYTGSEALPITLLFFNLLNVNSTRFVQLTGFRTNARFQLIDHIVVVQTVFAHAIFIEAAFLVAASDAECRNQRLTGPFTTQPIIETSIGVIISSVRCSSALTVPITSNS